MSQGLTTVYQAQHMAEAELLRQALANAQIEAVVDQTASPFDGLTAANQGTDVMVRDEHAERAQAVVAEFVQKSAGRDEDAESGTD